MITSWINEINTTSLRTVTSVFVAAIILILLAAGVLFFGFEPTSKQMTLLYAMGGLLAAMMSLDVAQFIGKRFSDATYAAAKNPTKPVSVDAPPASMPTAAPDGMPSDKDKP
jgi:hypothetical protein